MNSEKMKTSHLLLATAGVAALLLFPIGIDNPYYIHLLETIMIYAILLFGIEVARGEAPQGTVLAIGDFLGSLPGEPTQEPVFGLEAKWIPAELRSQADGLVKLRKALPTLGPAPQPMQASQPIAGGMQPAAMIAAPMAPADSPATVKRSHARAMKALQGE